MFELIQVSENCYYIQSPAKAGVVVTGEGEVCLIDSGSDKDAGRRIRQHLDAHGWRLRAIYNTHSHADHIGGNRYLQAQTGCRIYAPGLERAFTEQPLLEPALLYGGCPPAVLRKKFLMAQESEAQPLTHDALPEGWEMIPLPGHSFDMAGFRTPDDVVYLADCLSSRQTLQKYRVGYLWDVEAYLQTLEMVKSLRAKLFIPAHAEPAEDVSDLAQANIDAVRETASWLLERLSAPASFEELLRALFAEYSLTMTFEQHALVGSTLRSYLSWLQDRGELQALFEDNRLCWQRS